MNDIKTYPKLNQYIKENSTSDKEIAKIYKEIAATYSPSTVKYLESLFDHTFARVYDKIQIKSKENIKELAKKNHLILVPNHQSYADFLSISYVFHKQFNLPVYIAAGINLNVFPIGMLFRKGGAFFIRRSFKDQLLYKYVLEAYIHHLLKEQNVIKFYFEGARSRTGRLLPPKFGLFNMLLESYSVLKSDKPLCFLPISISHESLPESKSHKAEVFGGKKVRESSTQLIKLVKVLNKRFGSIHLRAGKPIYVKELSQNRKKDVQDIAFKCFRAVGKDMMVSPTSLLSLVLLDNISGALTYDDIIEKSEAVLSYCNQSDVPLTPNLEKDWRDTLSKSLELLVENKKIEKVYSKTLDRTFYHIPDENRIELLYLKNTILHHFLVPLFIGSAWVGVFRGSIDSIKSLRMFFLEQRKLLKHEFYLPETDDMFFSIRETISKIIEKPNFKMEESLNLDKNDFFKLGEKLGIYTTSFSYIYEAYYLAALTLKSFSEREFSFEDYKKQAKEIYRVESKYGKLIRFPESFSVHLMKSAMDFFIGEKLVLKDDEDSFKINRLKEHAIDSLKEKFATIISDFVTLNIKKF